MKVSSGTFPMLCVCIGRDQEEKYKVNFVNKIEKMKLRLQIWSQRNLSLLGRILVTKTHGASNMIYSLSMID